MMSKKTIFRSIVAATALIATTVVLAACSSSNSSKSSSNTKTTYKSELVKKDTLTVGTEGEYKPYAYRDNGKMTGFEVELAKAIGKKMGIKVTIVPTKWDSLIAGVGSGRFDLAMDNITATAARKKQYNFSSTYVYSHYILITKAGSPIKSVADLKGKKLAEGTGTDNEAVAKKLGATTVPNSNFTAVIGTIKDGRVDGAINSVSAWNDYKKSNSTAGLKATVLDAKDAAPAESAAVLNKKSPKLRTAVNKAITQLRADGTLKKLSVKYLGSDVTEK
ncbi:transporter substrate-binding domain-containing protein [Lacticaseibacillus sp. GG6-2]